MLKRLGSFFSKVSIQVRTTLLIVLIVTVTVLANLFAGMYFTSQSLDKTMEQDLSFAIGIANSLVGTEMNLMKSEAKVIAEQLTQADTIDEIESKMAEQYAGHEAITSLMLFDRNGIIANYSEPQHTHDIDVDAYIDLVYDGSTIISSPFYCSTHGTYVMNVYTPMPDDRILAVTMPGDRLSTMLSSHRLWDTGNMFMLNGEGMFIGTAGEDIVLAVNDYVDESKSNPDTDVQSMSTLIQTILSTDEGVATYYYNGEERLCAFSRITDSALGWRVAVTVPVSESPQSDAMEGYLYSAAVFLLVGALASFFLSRLLVRPFKRIEEQNLALEDLNTRIQKQSETIMEEHQRVMIMLDATPLASRLWNREDKIIACNEAAVKMFDLSSKQEYMDSYYNLAPERQPDGSTSRDKVNEMVQGAFEKGRVSYYYTYQLKDGTPVPCEVILVRVPFGEDYAVASYSRDLREEQSMMAEIKDTNEKLEDALVEAENANNAKSEFLAHMSHEIRTPLNAVIGLSELALGEDNLNIETETNLEKIYGAGSTILSIVNDILDISKIESGKFETNYIEYDTPSLINDTVTLNIVRIGEKPITFKLFVDEDLPASLFGDDLRVKQIFNNLLSNAFKYTQSGVVEWRISSKSEGDDVYLFSSIRDTGTGIKPEDMQNLFIAYNQVNMQSNRKIEGTGLGLAIAKSLAEMMDGGISVESEYGKGSTFSLHLKQRRVNGAVIGREVANNLMNMHYTISKRNRNKQMTRVNLSYARVLVVDDIETNLDVAKGMMKPYGMKIDCVTSGIEAIALIKGASPHYDAIFMDHMMPDMDGIEATRVIREDIGTAYAKSIPIIALTANAIAGNEEMFLNRGFQAFISKPIDIMKLDSILRQWVRNKKLERTLSEGDKYDAEGAEGVSDDSADLEDEQNLKLSGLFIDGIDMNKGLERFSGNEGVFIDVLRSYAANTRPLLKDLTKYVEHKDLENYNVVVHGIKGSSYGIGAGRIGAAAEGLEHAAKAGDLAAVKAHHWGFVEHAEILLDDIDATLAKIDSSSIKPVAAYPDPDLLAELKAACKAFDMDKVDSTLEKLEAYKYKSGEELVKWLRKQVNDMAFENICEGNWPKE